MSSSYAAVCLPLLFFIAVNGDINDDLITLRGLQNRILDLIELPIRYYMNGNVDAEDLNLMLGISIMKGQFMSCTDRSRNDYVNNDVYFERNYVLTKMVNELYSQFYSNNLTDMKTTRKILDHKLWTSSKKIIHASHIISPRGFNADFTTDSDLHFRNISDKCIRQVISTSEITPECVGPELVDEYSGYALTHQVLYIHILKKTNQKNLFFRKIAEKIILDKCSKIYNESLYIADDLDMLNKYKDLFIEQIAVCGMENMVEFVRPEWLSIVSSKNHFDCFRYKNKYCDSHMTGVSLAALGVYWKFLCYKANTIQTDTYY